MRAMTEPLPDGWRERMTDDERALVNRWARGCDWCVSKVGRRHWDSSVPGAPLFKTRKAAYEFLSRFVCEAIPRRCIERMEAETCPTSPTS
jgi:hypothetical protein